VWTSVARRLRWNEAYRFGGADQEFSWRAQLGSYRIGFAPDAVMAQRYRSTLPALARQWFAYGQAAPQLHRQFRSHGLPPPSLRAGLRRWRWLLKHAHHLAGPRARRGYWIRTAAVRAGRLAGSIRFRSFVP
jgi:GT2 family glycosyltransferase